MSLIFPLFRLIDKMIIEGSFRVKGRFRTEGKIYLPEGQPAVWNHDKFFKGGCDHGRRNSKMV
jgi:hypothetical protein